MKSTVFEHDTVEGDTDPVGVQMDIGQVGKERGGGSVGETGGWGWSKYFEGCWFSGLKGRGYL